ncbi:MAG: hypothetical protein E7459_03965 [Ruminococcaceae bacterium]|nr:hypothetical protein [Oscillospiraceae bacterium]
MTQSILMYHRQYHDRQGHCHQLEYYLLIDRVFFGCNSLDIYGAKIAHYEEDRLLTTQAVRGITPFGPKITILMNRLADGLVLPGGMGKMLL